MESFAPRDAAGALAAGAASQPHHHHQQQHQQQPSSLAQPEREIATADGASDIAAHALRSAAKNEPGPGPGPGQPSENGVFDKANNLPSPRHELELIPEDRAISTPHHSETAFASPRAASLALTTSNRASAASTPDTGPGLIRPTVHRLPPHPMPSRPTTRSPIASSISPVDASLSPAVIRTASASSRLCHPTPDINARSGAYTGNIAVLEATAERLSMTSSIDDAIREAHNELKRSDSRRSSTLAASVRSGDYGADSPVALLPSLSVGRQSSIVGLNNAARIGGYSPGGFIMSPTQSITGRLRSGSKGSSALSRANSTRSKPDNLDGEAFPNLSGSIMSSMLRNGPGTGSVRSIRSLQSVHSVQSAQSNHSPPPRSLAEVDESEPPSALTQEALDEADRTAPQLEDLGDGDESILARAHQHVEPDATDIEVAQMPDLHGTNDRNSTPRMEDLNSSYLDMVEVPMPLQVGSPANPLRAEALGGVKSQAEPRHGRRRTTDTDDEDNVFADFDGMHCDPDSVAELFPHNLEEDGGTPTGQRLPGPPQPLPPRRPQNARPARPKSYFDAETGQNMLYYPAHVPAMLNLPPKLGKGVKAAEAARNRRSQLLSQMPKTARESRSWLPDPLEGEGPVNLSPMPLMGDRATSISQHSSPGELGLEDAPGARERPGTGTVSHENLPLSSSGLQDLRRASRLGDPDAREPRTNLSELPAQVRASAYFDMPSQSLPKIEVKNDSAMDTLDSILDAAAAAPVNAFTDNPIAGPSGKEVYGNAKKTSRQSQLTLAPGTDHVKPRKLVKRASTLALPQVEKRRSVWDLLSGRGKSKSSVNLLSVQDANARSRRSGSADGDSADGDSADGADESSALAPDGKEEEEEEEEEAFIGQPATLLAELQMRKKQHENRTKNPLHSGSVLHSTLLELDAVAQHEAQSRQKKKINLAWAADSPEDESEDDEDIPLGLLAAKKQLGGNSTDYDMARELHRPLGLMERRELDDHEPLSRRRDRLQGKPVPVSMYLQPSGNATRMSVMPGSNSSGPVTPLRMAHPASPGVSVRSPNPEDDEHQGETLGERRRRLLAEEDGDNALPRARRVSTAFSEELLGELGIHEDKDAGRGKENAAPVEEEEETLGQRRRRLQAERKAREKEMGVRAAPGETEKPAVPRRLNMADVLAANPLDKPGSKDPHEEERRRKEEESIRYAREHEAKMRAFRAQVPTSIGDPKAGVITPGGYQNGRFNDSRGGLGGATAALNSRNQAGGSTYTGGQLGMQQGQSTNLIGAAGNYNNQYAAANGMNPVFAPSSKPFGHGYEGGILQSHPQFQAQSQPFVSGSLLASGGYGAFGGGVGAAGGYSANQTAYGGGVGFAGGTAPMGYGMQAGGMQVMTGQQQADLVERWRQGIR